KPRAGTGGRLLVAAWHVFTRFRNPRTERAASVRELLEEAKVVFVEQPDVFDLVAQDGDPLDPHAPGEPGVLLGVVPDGLEHRRVDHPAPEDLQPPGLFAHGAAGTVA